MNRQEAFNKAYLGIIAQGCKSVTDACNRRMCAYRGDNGAKCAVGHLLTDEQILQYHVGNSASVYDFDRELLEELLPGDESPIEFLSELQRIHDASIAVSAGGYTADFARAAKCFAHDHGLTVPEAA